MADIDSSSLIPQVEPVESGAGGNPNPEPQPQPGTTQAVEGQGQPPVSPEASSEDKWWERLPESTSVETVPTETPDGTLPPLEFTEADKAAIAATSTQDEANTYIQENVVPRLNKEMHDRLSAKLGREIQEKRQLQKDLEVYKAIATGRQPPSDAGQPPPVPGQPPTQAPYTPPRDPQGRFTPTPPAQPPAVDAALTQAFDQATADIMDPEKNQTPEQYQQNFRRYQTAQTALLQAQMDARMEARMAALQQQSQQQAEEQRRLLQSEAESNRVDRELMDAWKGDIHNPIPWAEAREYWIRAKTADPTLQDRVPPGTPQDRALWISHYVGQTHPRLYAERLEQARQKQITDLAAKRSAQPIQSSVTSPLKSQGNDPASVTQALLEAQRQNSQ